MSLLARCRCPVGALILFGVASLFAASAGSAASSDAATAERIELNSTALGEAIYFANTQAYFEAATRLLVAEARETEETQAIPRRLFLSSLLWQLGASDYAMRLVETTPLPENNPHLLQRIYLQRATLALRRQDLPAFEQAIRELGAQTAESSMRDDIQQRVQALRLQAMILSGDVSQAAETWTQLPLDSFERPFLHQAILAQLFQAQAQAQAQVQDQAQDETEQQPSEEQMPWEMWLDKGSDLTLTERSRGDAQQAAREQTMYRQAIAERYTLQQAFVSLSREAFSEALLAFDRIPLDSPFLAEALAGKIRAHVGLGDAEGARSSWQTMLKRTPADLQTVHAGLWVAALLQQKGALASARNILNTQANRLNDFRRAFQALRDVEAPLHADEPLLQENPIAWLYFQDLSLEDTWQQAKARWERMREAQGLLDVNARRLVALEEGFALKRQLRLTRASDAELDGYQLRRANSQQAHEAALSTLADRVARFGDLALAEPETQALWNGLQSAKARLARLQLAPSFTEGESAQRVLATAQGVLLWQAYEDSLSRAWRVRHLQAKHQAGLKEAAERIQRIERELLRQRDLERDEQRLSVFSQRWRRLSRGVDSELQREYEQVLRVQGQFCVHLLQDVEALDERIQYALARVEDALWLQQLDRRSTNKNNTKSTNKNNNKNDPKEAP
ncbi:MAG: hypothetical protein P8176_11905 [Gammaproteobacteria bacterium]